MRRHQLLAIAICSWLLHLEQPKDKYQRGRGRGDELQNRLNPTDDIRFLHFQDPSFMFVYLTGSKYLKCF
jgi:hypothetical protein